MNEDWKMLMPMAALGKMLDGLLSEVQEVGEMLEMPVTTEDSELAVFKAFLQHADLSEKLHTAALRLDTLRRHHAKLRVAELEAIRVNRDKMAAQPEPIVPKQEADHEQTE